jgi:hypothetical protein
MSRLGKIARRTFLIGSVWVVLLLGYINIEAKEKIPCWMI